ncbi:MAG: metallophosphoesterase [Deltaproteobacteria bacterium]|nr:metallophosphoesterase [Deltaproteobacteria bacterium]
MKREILFVGDIQGCSQELAELLKIAGFQAGRHRLIPVGDTINRGPDAPGVLRMLREVQAEPILGNHEWALLRYMESGEIPDWPRGGNAMEQLLGEAMLEESVSWIKSWPFSREGEDWVAVHAGLHPVLPVAETQPGFLTRVRFCDRDGNLPPFKHNHLTEPPAGFLPWFDYYQGPRTVMFGHWARLGLVNRGKLRGLDTGCVYGGELTGLWWPEDHLVRVSSRQPYRRLPAESPPGSAKTV